MFQIEEASELAEAAELSNPCGAISTWRKARAKLDPLPTHHRGIALSEFREALARFFADAGDSATLPARPKIRRSWKDCP
jgi:hypothetical protein